MSTPGSLTRLQAKLNLQFDDEALLERALTHRSRGQSNNERLEFLGDSILNHIIAESLFMRFPDCSEGDLSRMRAALVKGDTLAALARDLGLEEWVRVGQGELKSGARRRDSILADAFEAIVGAILLDAGLDELRARVLDWYASRLAEVSPELTAKDAKSSLQEYLQGRGCQLPQYRLKASEGQDHCQEFLVECVIQEPSICTQGRGSTRRRAEQAAASAALEAIGV